MDANQTSYCTVTDLKSQSRFLCYTHRKRGIFSICLTNAADVWRTEFTDDALNQFRQKFALKSTEDCILKLRSACGSGDVSVEVQDCKAELRVRSGDQSMDLTMLERPQAAEEVRELLFRMADDLTQLDTTLKTSTNSPGKNHQRRPTEFEPRQQQQNSAHSVTVKKRPAGASLINPGTKKKVQATGVAFDDADED